MSILYYEIFDKNKKLLISNLPSDYNYNISDINNKIKTSTCPITKNNIRHGYLKLEHGYIYLSSNDVQTNKIFRKYFEACDTFIPSILSSVEVQKEKIKNNFRRFKHNLITHHTNINQELESLFPIATSNIHGAKEQIDFIIKEFNDNPKKIAVGILKIIKSSNLMKAEFDVYDMLSSDNPNLELYSHSPHKLISLVISPFWLEFVEKGVKVTINSCKSFVNVDYRSISVVFSNILENASKYIIPNSELIISFNVKDNTIEINFEMVSLKIDNDEIDKIFESGKSGKLAKKLGLSGDGIGLSISSRLLSLNNGNIKIKTNTCDKCKINNKGIEYEKNIFVISLPKALHNTVYS